MNDNDFDSIKVNSCSSLSALKNKHTCLAVQKGMERTKILVILDGHRGSQKIG